MIEHLGYEAEQLKFRAQHGGLSADELRGRTIAIRVRATPDARLFAEMTTDQESAYIAIARAFNFITGGMQAPAMDYAGVKGGNSGNVDADYWPQLMFRYSDWHRKCANKLINARMALDVIADGLCPATVDRNHRRRKGTAKDNLFKALGVW